MVYKRLRNFTDEKKLKYLKMIEENLKKCRKEIKAIEDKIVEETLTLIQEWEQMKTFLLTIF